MVSLLLWVQMKNIIRWQLYYDGNNLNNSDFLSSMFKKLEIAKAFQGMGQNAIILCGEHQL